MLIRCRCCSHQTKRIFCDRFVIINECIKCKTLLIDHLNIDDKDIDKDYYSNHFYNQSLLEKSLLSTRKRQSLKILRIISKFTNKKAPLIDFGFGRGAFLKEAYKFGFHKLVGIESSKKAIEISETFFKKVQVVFDKNKLIFEKNILEEDNSEERIFVALDVLGLFSISNLNIWIEEILNRLIFPEYLIIKIPSRDGLLFNIAYFLAKFKIHNKFLHQLLQVGTFPPPYFYVSKKGLLDLFSKFNYEPIHISSDLDYEISSFGSRLNVKGIQKIIFNLVIPFLSLITKISNSVNLKIIFLRLKKNPIIPISN